MPQPTDRILRELVALPTAPFHEERVAAAIIRVAESRRLRWRMDRAGNLCVTFRNAARGVPIVFLAHMDHPGFRVRAVRGATVDLEVLGGAPRVRRGARLRLYGLEDGSRRVVTTASERRRGARRLVRARMVDAPVVGSPAFGMWDLPPCVRDGRRLRGRAMDDLAGCAAILEAMSRLSLSRRQPPVRAVFTRAEEVGFVGVSAALRTPGRRPLIPRTAVVVSVETSRWRAGAAIGQGPVVRLGDRAGLFDPAATTALVRVAESLRRRDRVFRFQRDLLDGGTCEATALRVAGIRSSGLACPLGNYHNRASDRRSRFAGEGVAEEFIDLGDWRGLVRLIEAAATRMRPEAARLARVRRAVNSLYRRYRSSL